MSISKARNNYIYLKSDHWDKHKNDLIQAAGLNEQSVMQAYKENAMRLRRNGGIGELPEDFGKKIVELLSSFEQEVVNKNGLESGFFQEISNLLMNASSEVISVGGEEKRLSQLTFKNLKDVVMSQEEFNKIVDVYSNILQEIGKFDKGFSKILGQPSGGDTVAFISKEGMATTRTAYNQIQKFLNDFGGQDINALSQKQLTKLQKDIAKTQANLTTNIRGGLNEYATYVMMKGQALIDKAAEEAVHEMKFNNGQAIGLRVLDAELSGVGDTNILDEQLSSLLGQKTFSNKSDNTVNLQIIGDGLSIDVNTGISIKSYGADSYVGKKISDGVKWQAVFQSAGLIETNIEYLLANVIINQSGLQAASDGLLRRYIAAKASAFLISGVEGGDTPQALFFRYADSIIYIPDALEQGHFSKLTLNNFTDKPRNERVGDSANNMIDAYARTKNTIANIRSSVKMRASL